ncbi:MAG TPA: hypothetical protein VHA06_22840, partial [Candidatus Angelobacter sp.]|nr:hypothetical protein [Candidatus Angelobacter sp.]
MPSHPDTETAPPSSELFNSSLTGEPQAPDDRAQALHSHAIQLFRERRFLEAQETVSNALALAETSIRWNDFATIAIARNDLAGAERGYRRAVEIDTSNVRAATNLIVLLESLGKISAASKFRHLIPKDLQAVVDASCAALAGSSALDKECTGLFNRIRSFSSVNPESPQFFRDAQQRGMANCEHFISQAMPLIVAAEAEVREELLGRLEHAAVKDYRCGALVAIYRMGQGDYAAALPLFRNALMLKPEELFVEAKLLECLRLHKISDLGAVDVE